MNLKVGIVQMKTCSDKEKNILSASEKVASCAKNGAQLVILPEIFNSPYSTALFREYSEPRGGSTYKALSKMASDNNIYLVGGSIPELDNDKVFNTSFIFNTSGDEIACHRKIHLFDINVKGGQSFKESDSLTPGDSITTFELKFGPSIGIIVGVCICFDFRFPDLARLMAQMGASVMVVPAVFNMTTGPSHWELMFRQRAVDNQCFTIGVAPARDTSSSYVSYANSIVVSPWGDVVYRADEKEIVQVVEIDLSRVHSVREQLPLLSARRTDLYEIRSHDYSNIINNQMNNNTDQNANNNVNNRVFGIARQDETLEIFNVLTKTQKDLHYKNIKQWTDEWNLYEIASLVRNNCFYTLKIHGKIVAVCCITENNEENCKNKEISKLGGFYLSKLAVLPEYQRKGNGEILIKNILSHFQGKNRQIILDVWSGNDKLKSFYEKIGFHYLKDLPEIDYSVSVYSYDV
ncbi:hypothetical protein TRFO_29738 [Tritrichomonas foetus]|uniref:Hydrolase, carbon-nitrogen family protein n=1 Tax=Tritrichomonas foetus TaxID=1144522 RepID=A0A1J4K0D7_9EUKA|nr:hypothetical protein TRFO_29738 [Tritrichomonas foetus]|eukprot:OHT02981.1 hypothetical protein TRFO_29738 [Tritrichomonas foetus]